MLSGARITRIWVRGEVRLSSPHTSASCYDQRRPSVCGGQSRSCVSAAPRCIHALFGRRRDRLTSAQSKLRCSKPVVTAVSGKHA